MTIAEVREKCKNSLTKAPRDILSIFILILASTLSFGLGYFAGFDAGSSTPGGQGSTLAPIVATSSASVMAAKGGTKYYFVGCTGADRISVANKIWFVSAQAAEEAGYTLAANCKQQ